MNPAACILGCSGLSLTPQERALFRDADPWGFILFARNVADPAQVRALTHELRDAVGRADAPVLIDQEGGRVQRLSPPHWRRYPAAAAYATLGQGAHEMAWLGARLTAGDLQPLGITVNCLPVLDLAHKGAHDAIGDRAYGASLKTVAALGRAACEGLMAGGVLPVLKHMPGQGRARADSHKALPVVEADWEDLERLDFAAFRGLADMPIAMTGHVAFSTIDSARPATTSEAVITRVVRQAIGFAGLLISDDLSMDALAGTLGERAEQARRAGCDIALFGGGDLAGSTAVAAAAGRLEGLSLGRARDALARRAISVEPFDAPAARARFEAAFAGHWAP